MRVLCINDAGRPDDVPATKWVKQGEKYTVIDVIKCNMQPGQPFAYVLDEIDLNGCGFYKGFASTRFVVTEYTPEVEQKVEEEALTV
jgi:hypothetical protein